jgi:hypothetical protein
MSLISDACRLRAGIDEIDQLRAENWPDSGGAAYARRHLAPLQGMLDSYRSAVESYEARIDEALARLSRG